MSIVLRVILVVSSVISFILCVKKIKQAKLAVENSIVWMCGSIILILMSIFSNSVTWISSKLGFISPANFVFMIIIAFLLIEVYINNLKLSELNEKIKNMNHYIALKEYKEKNKDGEKNRKQNQNERENN